MKQQCRWISSIIFIFCISGSLFLLPASADEVVLQNGDKLTGRVTGGENNSLTIETPYAGKVHIQTSKIRSVTTDYPVEVHLLSGEILKGRLSTDPGGNLVIGETFERGPMVFGWDRVSAVNPPPVPPLQWHGNITVGAGTQTGNSERTNITLGAEATRRTEQDRYSLRFLYNYAKEEDNVTARSYYGAAKYDYYFTRKFYGYLAVELLKDKTKDLNLRTVVGPGVGYQVWDDDIKFLALEAGLAYFSEDLKKGDDKDWLTARLAANFRYRISDSVVFSDQLVIYPSLENSKDYKLRNEAAIETLLGSGWSMRIANILEHDGNPPEGIERNDWYWLAGLQYGF